MSPYEISELERKIKAFQESSSVPDSLQKNTEADVDKWRRENAPRTRLQLTEREVKEICLCIVYAEDLAHGTDGHSRMLLIAKLAKALDISRPASDVIAIDGDMDTALSIADFCEQVEAVVKAGGASDEALQQLIAAFGMATKTCLEAAKGGEWK